MAQVKTAQEMFPLVESWQKSGLTQKAFSQQHQLSDQVFGYWVSRYRKAQPVTFPTKTTVQPTTASRAGERSFIRLPCPIAPVTPTDVAAGSTSPEIVVELPSGVVLRFSGLVPVSYLKELVGLSKSICSCSA